MILPLDSFGFYAFARLYPTLKDHLENGVKNAKMAS